MRQKLPDRRPTMTQRVELGEHKWDVTVGFDRQGKAREVFANGVLVGSDLEALFDDACVSISLNLQSGMTAEAVQETLGREGIDPSAAAASPVGMMAQVVATLEADHGADIAADLALIHGPQTGEALA